jgi:hypothetical protein
MHTRYSKRGRPAFTVLDSFCIRANTAQDENGEDLRHVRSMFVHDAEPDCNELALKEPG